MKWPILLLGMLPVSASADVEPLPMHRDPRLRTVRYIEGEPVRIATAPGVDLTLLFGRAERIGDVRLSDDGRFQVTLSQSRNSLVLHTKDSMNSSEHSVDGTMVVSSTAHDYAFILSSVQSGQQFPYVLRLIYTRASPVYRRNSDKILTSQYRLTGSREVSPSSLKDDGAKTFIEWPADAAIPAVFALEHGREEIVNGFMRAGVFTIDRVHQHLVFRIDKLKADAVRQPTGDSNE